MTIVVTGGAGFIGSNLVQWLNARGIDDIMVVDDLRDGSKSCNLADLRIADYLDLHEFATLLERDALQGVDAVLHQGACSDTLEQDGRYMMQNNYRCSLRLLDWCQAKRVPLLYASSAATYGASSRFAEDPANERPLNVYGYSKLLFDQIVRRRAAGLTAPVYGFRYFNVYGPREQHKGRMASVAFHNASEFREKGEVALFEGSHGYPDGGQLRDFVSVDDVCEVNGFFLERAQARMGQGILNCGTGRAQPFNDVACSVVNAFRAARGEAPLPLADLVMSGRIRYKPFPEALKGRYQAYTQADLAQLRAHGYDRAFASVEEGVTRYVSELIAKEPA